MASIRQRGAKGTWYALYRDAQGTLVQRSTKLGPTPGNRKKSDEDKKKAQAMADTWEKSSRPAAGNLAATQMRKVLAEMHRRLLGTELPQMTVRAFFAQWLSAKKAEIGPDGYTKYKYTLELFEAHLGKRADEDLYLVTRHDVTLFRNAQLTKTSAETVNQKLKVLRMAFRAAREDEWTPEDPAKGVKPAKVERIQDDEKRQPFTPDQLRQILAGIDEELQSLKGRTSKRQAMSEAELKEWRAMVIRGYYTGQRLKDIALMICSQEDPLTQHVTCRTSKTGQIVIISMHPAYLSFVLQQEAGDDPSAPLHPLAYASVMKRIDLDKDSATVTLSGQFCRILARAGLRGKESHRKRTHEPGKAGKRAKSHLTYHSLRHSFVSHLAAAGVSRSLVQDLVGHENESVNANYTKFDAATKREAIEKLPNILG